MIVAFGTSTPTSITVVATRTSSSPRLEARHQLAPLGRPQPAVHAADPEAAQLAARAAARPPPRPRARSSSPTPRSAGRRRTPAGPRRGARAAACTPRSCAPRSPSAVTIGFRVRRRLRDLADRQVAVDGERERARDRRRGHVQDVRRAALGERRALLDAEAVLLVDDRDGEVGELDLLLDQRVRADGDRASPDAIALAPRVLARAARSSAAHADAELARRAPRS